MSRMAFLSFFPVWPVFALLIYHNKRQTNQLEGFYEVLVETCSMSCWLV